VNRLKKGVIIGLILVAGLILVSAIYAHGPGGGHGMGHYTTTNIDVVEKFQKETLPLRDELITKRLEIKNEYNKVTPDRNRIATLKKEIIDIELKIQEKADTVGLSQWGCGMGYSMMGRGMGHGMMGRGMMAMECPCQR
jgi:hypothetical protein